MTLPTNSTRKRYYAPKASIMKVAPIAREMS